MYKKYIIIALEIAIIAACYVWIRFTHVGLDAMSASVCLIFALVIFLFTLRTLDVRRLVVGISLAGLLAVMTIGSIEIAALLQENQVRREYPEPCSFERSPQISRFKHFGILIMQCREDGTWGARTD